MVLVEKSTDSGRIWPKFLVQSHQGKAPYNSLAKSERFANMNFSSNFSKIDDGVFLVAKILCPPILLKPTPLQAHYMSSKNLQLDL